MKRLLGECDNCDYYYYETLWLGKDVPPEMNEPIEEYECSCGGSIHEKIIEVLD